jgi:hypothetical protein
MYYRTYLALIIPTLLQEVSDHIWRIFHDGVVSRCGGDFLYLRPPVYPLFLTFRRVAAMTFSRIPRSRLQIQLRVSSVQGGDRVSRNQGQPGSYIIQFICKGSCSLPRTVRKSVCTNFRIKPYCRRRVVVCRCHVGAF